MTNTELDAIRSALRHLTMESADFGRLAPDSRDGLPTKEKDVTQFIRERTRVWRESWVIAPLEQIVKNEEARRARTRKG